MAGKPAVEAQQERRDGCLEGLVRRVAAPFHPARLCSHPGGQLQRVADGFPLSFNNAASRFQTWAEGAGSTVGKSAQDAFQYTRQLFKPLRPEDVRPPSETSSSS